MSYNQSWPIGRVRTNPLVDMVRMREETLVPDNPRISPDSILVVLPIALTQSQSKPRHSEI
ncbi:hypothetical protein NBRC116594_33140 [Shimia sp. NS0008-38b]